MGDDLKSKYLDTLLIDLKEAGVLMKAEGVTFLVVKLLKVQVLGRLAIAIIAVVLA